MSTGFDLSEGGKTCLTALVALPTALLHVKKIMSQQLCRRRQPNTCIAYLIALRSSRYFSWMGDWYLVNNMNQSLMCTFPSTTDSFGSVLWLCSQCLKISLSRWLCLFLRIFFKQAHFSSSLGTWNGQGYSPIPLEAVIIFYRINGVKYFVFDRFTT